MSAGLKPGVVYVCPVRDIECGDRADNWCQECPKRPAKTPPLDIEKERAEFEAAHKGERLHRNFNDEYIVTVQCRWEGWLAAKRATQPAVELNPRPSPPRVEKCAPLTSCAADRDGECVHAQCPQLRDNEPRATGRHCPLDTWTEVD